MPNEYKMKLIENVVDSPAHYNSGSMETIEVIKNSMGDSASFNGYLMGNVFKYVCRYRYKGKPVEDLKKARWYLNRLIEEVKDDK